MQTRLHHLMAAFALLLATTGCVIHEHNNPPPQPVPGNVNVVWRFTDGNSCASLAPFISHMQVTIPGEQLQNFGQFPCTVAGTQGIQLQDFAAGTYQITVQAIDSTGTYPIYTFTGSFTVNGDVTVDAPLSPTTRPPAPGNVNLLWTFGDGQTCANLAGYVSNMVVAIQGEVLPNSGQYPCQLQGTQGIQLTNFAGGTYNYSVDAVDASGAALYHASGTFSVDGDVTVNATLVRTSTGGGSGTLQIRWGFLDAQNVMHGCAQAGVDSVEVTLGNYSPITVACSVNGVDGGDFNNLPVGTYTVVLQGLVGSGSQAYAAYTYSQAVVVGSGNNLLQANLSPLYGSWDLSYNFANAAGCGVAGVASISVSVRDASNQEISGFAPGQTLSCSDGAAVHWDAIAGGSVTIQMYGYSSGGQVIRGALRSTTLVPGAANATTVTLDTCGTSGSGC